MKLLVGISSCGDWENIGYNDVIRKCWLNDCAALGIDYRIFIGMGQGEPTGPDIINLNCEDGMEKLTYKHQLQLRWAYKGGYDFIYRAFPDTYCRPERLLCCGFEQHDFHGDFRGELAKPDNFTSGGPGCLLSRKSMGILLNAPIIGSYGDDTRIEQADDLWSGQILARHYEKMRLRYFDDNRFINRGACNPGPLRSNNIVASHLSYPGAYTPDRMLCKHQEWLAS